MIFDKYDDKEISKILFEISRFLVKGYDRYFIFKQLKSLDIIEEDFNEFFEIAKARIKGEEKFGKNSGRMFFLLEDLRFSTPEIVANYRAKRLKGKVVLDLCSGIGSQTISFAKKSKKVYAVEIDLRKVEYAKRNAAALDVDNVEFICGDVLNDDIVGLFSEKKIDIIFCDPERLASEVERRIENISLVNEILDKYSKICSSICVEVPPQIRPLDVSFDCEKEYVSLGNDLNRLNLYFGSLKKCDVSVVALPSGKRIESSGNKKDLNEKVSVLSYIYDVDRAVLKAGLLNELVSELGKDIFVFKKLKKNLFLTSDRKGENAFLERFKVVKAVRNDNKKIVDMLFKLNASEIVLRGSIAQEDFWKLKKGFEKGLVGGGNKFYLFLFEDVVLICLKE